MYVQERNIQRTKDKHKTKIFEERKE
jgi:hypothetical protein